MNKNIIIIGAGGHGKVVSDIAKEVGYNQIFFLDDNDSLKKCNNYEVIGKIKNFNNYYDSDFFVAIGNNEERKKIISILPNLVTLVHPSAVIGSNVELGKGTVIMPGVVINACTKIGDGCIINTCSSIDHDCKIGNYTHISVGAHLAGNVSIGDNDCLGIGSIVKNNVLICSNTMIGAGAVVVKNICKEGTYIGVPAKKID